MRTGSKHEHDEKEEGGGRWRRRGREEGRWSQQPSTATTAITSAYAPPGRERERRVQTVRKTRENGIERAEKYT